MRHKLLTVLLLLAIVMLTPVRLAARVFYGQASWYGKHHQGKRMADGHLFDRYKFTAASRTIPLGRKIKVTYLRTMKQIEVTVTDRGPNVKSRILDLSEAAADALGMKGAGLGRVSIDDGEIPKSQSHVYRSSRRGKRSYQRVKTGVGSHRR